MSSRSLRVVASATSTLALVAAGLAVTATAAPAAPADPGSDPCPAAYDVSTLVPGVSTVTGLTTVRGTTPEEFHGTYVGSIDDGIGPGLDLPVFDMAGSRITKADGSTDAGIWAGMSGSPVYDDATGKLVGAVSYGFSNNASPRAGVTPASYMYDLDESPSPARMTYRTTVKATAKEASAIAKASDEPGALGVGKLVKPSKQVSGAPAAKANAAAAKSKLLKKKAPFKSGGFRAGGSAGGTAADYPIQVGGNIATTFSTGDVTTAAVGTVTAICGTKVFAFGHPDEFTGTSNETFNGASAVDVQEDGGLGTSYKIANVGKVKGVINQDRIQGILGTLGQEPANQAQVVTHATGPSRSRDASTDVSVQAALPYVVSTQVVNDAIAVLNQNAGGDALMTWTVTYVRTIKGVEKTFAFKRTQRYSVAEGFLDAISFDAASDVESLLSNEFEKIRVTNVTVQSELQPDYRAYKVNGAQVYKGNGVWKNLSSGSTLKTKAGARLKLRVKLGPANYNTDVAPTTVPLEVKTSPHSTKTGSIQLTGLAQSFSGDDDEFFFGFEDDEEEYRPASFEELVDYLKSTPRADSVRRRLHTNTKYGALNTFATLRAPGVVSGNVGIRLSFAK